MTRKTEQQLQVDFVLAIVTPGALTAATEWISENMQPGDVFSSEQLEDWARAAGFQRPA